MIKVTYSIDIVTPGKEFFHTTDTIKDMSDLSSIVNASGLTVSGAHFKNGILTRAASQLPLGTDFTLNSQETISIQRLTEDPVLDVEEVFGINGKYSYEVRPELIGSMRILTKESGDLFKLNHILTERSDVIVFEIGADGQFTIVPSVDFNGPSHLLRILSADPDKTYVYFLVGQATKIGKGNNLHIPTKDFQKLPEGFCTIRNRLSTKTNVKFTTQGDGFLFHSEEPTKLSFSYPASVDGVTLSEYETYSREYLLVKNAEEYLTVDKLNDMSDNITIIYKLAESGEQNVHLCIVEGSCVTLLDSLGINYEEDSDLLVLLEADSEFKKAYTFVQHNLKVTTTENDSYFLENKKVLAQILNDTTNQFSNKIVKI